MSYAFVAVAAVTLLSSGYSAYNAHETGRLNENANKQRAAEESAAAEEEAARIREKAERIKASQIASLAASGVKLTGDGSAGALLNETDRLAEQDALAVLRGGASRASYFNRVASNSAREGDAGMISAGLNAVATGVNAYNSANAAERNNRRAEQITLSTPAVKPVKRYSLLGDT